MIEWAITASAFTISVILLRAFFRKRIGRKLQYLLWGLVLLRLLIPISLFQSPVSVTGVFTVALITENSANLNQNNQTKTSAASAEGNAITTQPGKNSEIEPGNEASLQLEESSQNTSAAITVFERIWFAGAVLAVVWLACANGFFSARLKKTRRIYFMEGSSLPVYVTDAVASPCLFGLFRPAVYLTNKAAETWETEKHVLTHELCHYRQGDHVWSFFRGLCVAVWWWNPFVWGAVFLARMDSELACDDAAIRLLGEESRLAYGRTLVAMIPVKGKPADLFCAATTMSAGKHGMKERLTMMLKRPKISFPAGLAAILLALFCAGCAFAGPETTAEPTDESAASGNIYVTIGCDEPVYEIGWDTGGSSGGVCNADNTPYEKGDRISLDVAFDRVTDYTVRALGMNGAVLAEASYTMDFSDGASAELNLGADMTFSQAGLSESEATYSFLHIGPNGETLSSISPLSGDDAALAQNIVMDYMLKSTLWPGVDITALKGYYIIRQSLQGETHDYYAFTLATNEVTGAVLQNGKDGFYSRISDELYQSLEAYMVALESDQVGAATDGLAKKQTERLTAFLSDFSEPPRGEDGFGREYAGDWDGDGKADNAYMNEDSSGEEGYVYNSAVVVDFGNGEQLALDAETLEDVSCWGSTFTLEAADLTGDGQNEIIFLVDLGGQGGRGSYGLYPYTKKGGVWRLMDAPYHGYALTLDWRDGLASVESGDYLEIIADSAMLQAHYRSGGMDSDWETIKDAEYHVENAADAPCDFALVQKNGKTAVKIIQYTTGMTGSHADELGYLATTLSWDPEGTPSIEEMQFILCPQ